MNYLERHYSVAFDGKPEFAGAARLYMPMESATHVEKGRFRNPVITEFVEDTRLGDYLLLGTEFAGISGAELDAKFLPIEQFRRTRENSSRGITETYKNPISFGQLLLKSKYDDEAAELVAIKPFKRVETAVHEYEVMNYLNKAAAPSGNYSSFRPLGFHVSKSSGEIGVITAYEHNVISYDNLFDKPALPSRLATQKALANCAFVLGHLHNLGLSFGDCIVRNFAHGNSGVRLIDVESVKSMQADDGKINKHTALERMTKDLRKFYTSANRRLDLDRQFDLDFLSVYIGAVQQRRSVLPRGARLTLEQAQVACRNPELD